MKAVYIFSGIMLVIAFIALIHAITHAPKKPPGTDDDESGN